MTRTRDGLIATAEVGQGKSSKIPNSPKVVRGPAKARMRSDPSGRLINTRTRPESVQCMELGRSPCRYRYSPAAKLRSTPNLHICSNAVPASEERKGEPGVARVTEKSWAAIKPYRLTKSARR